MERFSKGTYFDKDGNGGGTTDTNNPDDGYYWRHKNPEQLPQQLRAGDMHDIQGMVLKAANRLGIDLHLPISEINQRVDLD